MHIITSTIIIHLWLPWEQHGSRSDHLSVQRVQLLTQASPASIIISAGVRRTQSRLCCARIAPADGVDG